MATTVSALTDSARGTVWDGDLADTLAPYRAEWRARCARYDLHRAYYAGTVYQDMPDVRKALKLYAGVRQVFGPLRRAVRVDVAKVPGDWEYKAATPPAVRSVIDAVRAASDYKREYARAVHYGAVCGEFGLYVSADPTPRVHALRPDDVVIGETDSGAPFGLVIQPRVLTRNGRVERATFITPDSIRQYERGRLIAGAPNPFGVVPVWRSAYLSGVGDYGESAFSGAQELLDRVNDLASQALDVVQSQADPILAVSGVDQVQFAKGDNVLVLPPPDARAYPINPQLVIDQATELLDRMLSEFKAQLPQLALDLIQSRNDLAYETVITLLTELIDHVYAVRRNVDLAIAAAERAAAQIGAMMGLWPSYDWAMHAIDEQRPVIAAPRASTARGDQSTTEVTHG